MILATYVILLLFDCDRLRQGQAYIVVFSDLFDFLFIDKRSYYFFLKKKTFSCFDKFNACLFFGIALGLMVYLFYNESHVAEGSGGLVEAGTLSFGESL